MSISTNLKRIAQRTQLEAVALYLAYRHSQTPWYAKLLAIAVVVYAISPVDLIPDFIPVIGYLDDAILIPLGVLLITKLVPKAVMTQCRAEALLFIERTVSLKHWAAAIVICTWLLVLVAITLLITLNTHRSTL